MKLPIANQLKKRKQLEIALLQDELIQIIYSVCDDVIIHRGTAIWRCYGGKRFSQDIDAYSQSLHMSKEKFEKTVKSRGLRMEKYKDTGNVIFSSISDGRVTVQLEVNHSVATQGEQVLYELVDGTVIEVFSLSPQRIVLEKISAYLDRLFVRDLYDIYHLLQLISDLSEIRGNLQDFLNNLKKPIDETVLKSLIYVGLAPSFERMVSEIRRMTK